MSTPQQPTHGSAASTPAGWLRKHWLHTLVLVLAALPLVLMVADFLTNNLGVNPIRELTARTGTYALATLVLSLACTPINTVFGWKRVLPLRRTLGLYAFFYATLHMLTFTVLDYQLNLQWIGEAVIEQPYVLVGTAAFLILLPLAITSTRGWMRRLGKNWKRLHQLVYVAIILVLLHFVWVVKGDLGEPLIWGAVVALLLVLRIPAVRRTISTWRSRWRQRRADGAQP